MPIPKQPIVGDPVHIAVASSGLGHIQRGIETWAADTAKALHATGHKVRLFQGAGLASEPWQQVLPCKRRFEPGVQHLVRRLRRVGGWRYGFGNGYQAEQTTFAIQLWRHVRHDFDILHVQDPWVGLLMERLHRLGLSKPRVVLAHGTEEPAAFLRKFSYLQHLAPCYVDASEEHRPGGQAMFAIPNFVNTRTFCPGDARAARARWNLPEQGLVVLCVAAIKKNHKRIDYLVREFAAFLSGCDPAATLVIAGSREAETEEVMQLGNSLLGKRVRFLEGVDRSDIPHLYQAADLFTLASLHEMMPIALLEALATGLPITCNDTPTLRWMAGCAGNLRDISATGGLKLQWNELLDVSVRNSRGRQARAHAEETFSEAVVVQQVLDMYRQITDTRR